MNLKLIPKTKEEQKQFLDQSKLDFNEALIKALDLDTETAKARTQQSFERAFQPKDGVTQVFVSIFNHELGQSVGGLWFTLDSIKSTAYLYQILIDSSYRGKGYGKLAMSLLEDYCKEYGMKQISLNVFGYNTPARHLYQGIGYEDVQCRMRKNLQ